MEFFGGRDSNPPDLMCCLPLSGFLSDSPDLSQSSENKEKFPILSIHHLSTEHCVLCSRLYRRFRVFATKVESITVANTSVAPY